jgi:predicted DNA-binding antitoxin AbrB/MazE fold protein
MKTFQAIYEDGVFKPTEPVDLPEHSRVKVEAEPGEPQTTGKAMTGADLMRFHGTVDWPEDAVAYQRRIREEWL